jgi:RNA polymerase sigma-70 factor (ECF subfamily)
MTESAVAAMGGPGERREGPGAFRDVFGELHPVVLRHLRYLTGDARLAEDLAQEAFGRMLELARTGETLSDPRAWLLKVSSNLAYNHFRAESRRAEREMRAAIAEDAGSEGSDVDELLDVRAALERLGPRDRAALLLRHSGFSYAEVADALGLAPASVGTILARAQRRFREEYEGSRPQARK